MSDSKRGSWTAIGLWVLKGLVALVFIAAGAAKLAGAPMMVADFNEIGFGQGFRVFTGLVEVVGGVVLLVPRTSPLGAGLLFCVSVGALIAQITRLQEDAVHAVVLMALTGWLIWAGRGRLPALGKPARA